MVKLLALVVRFRRVGQDFSDEQRVCQRVGAAPVKRQRAADDGHVGKRVDAVAGMNSHV